MHYFISADTSSLTHGLFRNVSSVSTIWGFFSYLYVTDFNFDFIVVGKHALYDFNYFQIVEVCFNSPTTGYMLCLGMCSMGN